MQFGCESLILFLTFWGILMRVIIILKLEEIIEEIKNDPLSGEGLKCNCGFCGMCLLKPRVTFEVRIRNRTHITQVQNRF